MTNSRNRARAMRELSATRLAAHDARLFLNNQPNNRAALEYFHIQNNAANQMEQEYVARYGPLTAHQVASTDRWTWIDSPWPWEMED